MPWFHDLKEFKPMDDEKQDRPYLRRLAELAVAVALAYLAARFGIVIPPPTPASQPTVVVVDPAGVSTTSAK